MTADHRAETSSKRELLRFLRLLAKRADSGLDFEDLGSEIVLQTGNGPVSFSAVTFERAKVGGLVHLRSGRCIVGLDGIQALQAKLAKSPAAAPGKPVKSVPAVGTESAKSVVNHSESPIARLFNRKTKTGKPYLSEAEYLAGEKLRRDFEVGQLQPRITANYSHSAGSAGKGGKFHAAEISDFAMDARDRVNKAVHSLGPELCGVALDVCCFLKGLELVEAERS